MENVLYKEIDRLRKEIHEIKSIIENTNDLKRTRDRVYKVAIDALKEEK